MNEGTCLGKLLSQSVCYSAVWHYCNQYLMSMKEERAQLEIIRNLKTREGSSPS